MPCTTDTNVVPPALTGALPDGCDGVWARVGALPDAPSGYGGAPCREAYVTAQPFFATAMTLGEFRSSFHHAGYEGLDSEPGYLVELGIEGAPYPGVPKLWLNTEVFPRLFARLGDRQLRSNDPRVYERAREALNVIRERNGLPTITAGSSGVSTGEISPPRAASEHDVMYHLDGDIVRVDIPRGFQADPCVWSGTPERTMADTNPPASF